MKKVGLLLISIHLVCLAYAQDNKARIGFDSDLNSDSTHDKFTDTTFYFKNNGSTNLLTDVIIPDNQQDTALLLVPQAPFRQIMLNDIALMNGIDKTADFTSFVNLSLVDKPGVKLNFTIQKVPNKGGKFKAPYFHNIGLEMNLKENLSDLVKGDFSQYKGVLTYSGSLFLNKFTRFKYDNDSKKILHRKIGNAHGYDNLQDANRRWVASASGDTSYYRIDGLNMTQVAQTDSAATSEIYLKAEWNSKKYYWFGFTVKGGLEGLNFYDSGKNIIERKEKGVFEADVSFNFYHWTNPKKERLSWLGTKFITTGFKFSFMPQDGVKQKDYITIKGDSTFCSCDEDALKNREYSLKSAYDLVSYTEVFRLSPYFDWYNFLNKEKTFGFHIGAVGLFDYALRADSMKWTSDATVTFGLVFNVKQCYGNCDEKKQGSRVNFELQVVAENIHENRNNFKESLSPRLKVGIPFTNLNR